MFILFFERMAQITQQNSIKIIWFLLIMIIFLVFQLSIAHNDISELRSMCYELESRIEDDYDKQMQQAHLKKLENRIEDVEYRVDNLESANTYRFFGY